MPYTLSNPPDRIKKLPKHAQAIFIGAYNNAYKRRPDDEVYCNKVAWAAVKAKYHQDKSGKWKRNKATEEVDISFEHIRDLVSAAVQDKYGKSSPAAEIGCHMWVVDTYADHVIASGDDNRYWSIPYSIDTSGEVTLGDPTEVERAYVEVEERMVLEGWLPKGTSQNDLDDGDFAWLSDAYKSASLEEREGMNKRENRKLPYKVRGEVNREGWKAAWRAIAWKTYLRPALEGGPSKDTVIAKLRRDKPAGIVLRKDNTYTDSRDTAEERLSKETLAVMSDGLSELEILLEEDGSALRPDGVMRVRGTALIDEAVSTNNRYYSKEFNDQTMKRTNTWMTEGGVVTVFSRHGKAVGPLATGLPVGKVVDPLFRAGDRIKYIAEVHPTEEGKDVQVLIRGEVFLQTSIRTRDFRSSFRQLNGRVIEVMEDAIIQGIDLTDDAGVLGAGIEAILEETPTLDPLDTVRKEDEVEYSELTLAALQENRPDLLQEHAVSVLEANKPVVTEEQVTTLQGQVTTLTEERDTLTVKVGQLELDLAIEQASQIGVGREIATALREKAKKADEIPPIIEAVREEALSKYLAGAGTDPGKGKGEIVVEEKVQLTPEQANMVRLAGGRV